MVLENVERMYPNLDEYAAVMEREVLPKVDLALTYKELPGRLAAPPHGDAWQLLSYVTQPLEAFTAKAQVPFEQRIDGVAWFCANCNPGLAGDRLKMLDALMPTIKRFDAFGRCRNTADLAAVLPLCAAMPRKTVDRDAVKDCTFSHYKFHLAAESNSQDGHMTEKLWQGLANGGSVPVYWGAPDVVKYLPHPDAVVSVHAYDSMQDLADYLEACMANKTMYDKHLAWKRMDPSEWNPEFLRQVGSAKPGMFCQVCDRAVREKEKRLASRAAGGEL